MTLVARATRILLAVAAISYPLAVMVGIRGGSGAAVALVAAVGAAAMLWLHGLRGSRGLLACPWLMLALSLAALVLDEGKLLLAAPVAVNLVLLAAFAGTLITPPTMIERFAALVEPALTPDRRAHCRQATWAWAAFFAVNAAVTAWLALEASVEAWALHTGVIGYVAMGTLFVGELVVRERRFPGAARAMFQRLSQRVAISGSGEPPADAAPREK